MDSHNSDGSRAATARAGFMALFAVLTASRADNRRAASVNTRLPA
jgi:hypothetical protein